MSVATAISKRCNIKTDKRLTSLRQTWKFKPMQGDMMDVEAIRDYCLSKKGVSECLPFSDTALVFKVADKMFALLDLSDEKRGISLKCDPDFAVELRERYSEVTPAYHFNKKHWNGIDLSGTVAPEQLKQWIDHAYDVTVQKLSRKNRDALEI